MTFVKKVCPTCQQRVHVVASSQETVALSCGHAFAVGTNIQQEMALSSPPEVSPTAPEQELAALRLVQEELTHKIQHLVELLDTKGLLEEHAYTFPDGDIWKAQDVEPAVKG